MTQPYTVSLVNWHDGEPLLKAVRTAVFIQEQGVPQEMEWDEHDATCRHALALSLKGDAIACGRMFSNGHIGRIAVMPEWRGKMVGTSIMEAFLNYAEAHGYPQVDVDAQVHAKPFYQRLDFVELGEVFIDAGIPHIKMLLKLK